MRIADAINAMPGFMTLDFAKSVDPGTVYTIASFETEEVGEKREQKAVLAFLETGKKLVVNACRGEDLYNLFGAEDPKGKQVSIELGQAKNGAATIRIVAPTPAAV